VEPRPSSGSTKASSYYPASPQSPAIPSSEIVKIRRRSSLAQAPAKDAFALPPPPTRSRKIIQMKPRGQLDETMETVDEGAKAGKATSNPSKKKAPSSTSVAGRKIARKTAHSLIERRRRSKMNEEFGVLKDMIPACTGQEMHKLAILQASIEYMRYLEQCLTDLKAAHSQCRPTSTSTYTSPPPPSHTPRPNESGNPPSKAQAEDSDEDSDEEMSDAASPHTVHPHYRTASSAHSNRPSISPAILPSAFTSPAISSHHQREYSYNSTYTSALPSPAYEAQNKPSGASFSTFQLTSPALRPQDNKDMEQDDHEATAALLMLNTDRRKWSGPSRGMSVKDLLSG